MSAGLFLGCHGSACPAQVCCRCHMEQWWADTLKTDAWLSLTDQAAAACFQRRRIALLQLWDSWTTSAGPGKVLVNPQIITFANVIIITGCHGEMLPLCWMKQMVVISSDFLFSVPSDHIYTPQLWAWIQSEFTSIPAASSLNRDAILVQEVKVRRSHPSGWSESLLNSMKEGTRSHWEISRKSSGSNGNKGNTLLRLSAAFR